MRESLLAVCLVLLVALLAGGCGQTPSGPVVNNSGDGNFFNFVGDDADHNVATPPTPAPIITPVVLAPTPAEPVAP